MATLYRKQGQSQVVDQQGNLQNFSGNLDTLPIYNQGTVKSDQIKPSGQMNFGKGVQDTTNYAGITGGVSDALINEFNTLNSNLKGTEENQWNIGADILNIMDAQTGKTADTQRANELAGVNTETENLRKYTEQLAGLNSQASILNREAQAIPLLTQENNRNTGATDRGVAPQEAGALRLNAIKALSIAQQADIASAAATGSQLRLQAAKDKAQQIVDLKYKPLEDALAIKKEQYLLNKDILASIDKKRTEALTLALNREERQLEDAKFLEKSLQDMSFEARKNGAPDSIVKAISGAKNFEEAVIAMGRYIREPVKASAPSAPIIKSINGVDMQWDAKSGKWINPTGVSGVAGADTTQDTLNKFTFIRDTATEANRLAGSSGKSGLRRTFGNLFVGDSKYNQLEAHVNTLKTNMLTLATDPNIKKFFGPQMSNADVELMVSAGTTLNPKYLSEKQMRAEIKRIDDFINRAQTAVQRGQSGGNVLTAPDGTQIEIID